MAIRYESYFDRIPKLKYDINRSLINPKYEEVTNIFFRVRVIREVINNINSYFVAEIEDGDTPEILAEKVYKDAGAGWIITMANEMVDPQWDWPLNYDEFNKYITGKYGSVENAKLQTHHYEMVITSTLNPDDITTERRYIVNGDKLTENMLTVPYNYFRPDYYNENFTMDSTLYKVDSTEYTVDFGNDEQDPGEFGLQPGSLAFTQYVNNYNIGGKTIREIVRGEAINTYDYEQELNESKRLIRIIKREYYEQIQNEFNALTGSSTSFLRRVT